MINMYYVLNRKKYFLLGIALLVVLVVGMMVGVKNINAAKYRYPSPKDLPDGYEIEYTSIEVHEGDTVYDIAKKEINNKEHATGGYATIRQEVAQIKTINNLDDNCVIVTGNYIVVPYIVKK